MKIGPADPEILLLRVNIFGMTQNLVAMATSIEESEKMELIKKIHANTYHLVKIVKIGPVDPEIALLNLKKETRNA